MKRGSDNKRVRASAARYARASTPSGVHESSSSQAASGGGEDSGALMGPLRTANELISKRAAVKAAREQKIKERAEGLVEKDDEDELDEYERAFRAVKWPPLSDSSSSVSNKLEEESVYYPMPKSLSDMCIDLLVQFFYAVEDVGPLSSESKSKLAYELSRHRQLSADALIKLTSTPAPSLVLPECSAICEESLIAAIIRVASGVDTRYELPVSTVAEDDEGKTGLDSSTADMDLAVDMGFGSLGIKLQVVRLNNCGNAFTDKAAGVCVKYACDLEVLELRGCYRLNDSALCRLLAQCTNLQELDLSFNSRLGAAALLSISRLPGLAVLTLDHTQQLQYPNDGIKTLTKLSGMRSLSFAGLCLDDSVLKGLLEKGKGLSLNKLVLRECRLLTDVALAAIRDNCRAIQHLDLSDIPGLTKAGLLALFETPSHIPKMGTLADANESKGDDLSPSIGPLEVVVLKNLDSSMDDDVLIELARTGASTLQSLSVNGCRQIGGRGVMALALHCHSTLYHLDLSFARGVPERAVYGLVKASTLSTSQPFLLTCWSCRQLSRILKEAIMRTRVVEIEGLLP